jgi:hypothetical protein
MNKTAAAVTEDGDAPAAVPSTELYARERTGADLAPDPVTDDDRAAGLEALAAIKARRHAGSEQPSTDVESEAV